MASQPASEQPCLLEETSRGITTLTLNRPHAFNALSEDLLDAMTEAFGRLTSDDTTRVIVLAANGKAFCPGHDLKEMRASSSQEYYQTLFQRCAEMMQSIVRCPKPVVARVHGLATAAGCQLVATCDLAVASSTAAFGVSGIKQGLFCSTPSVALSRNVGRKQAFEMLFTGEFVSAEDAVRLGLVNRAVEPDELDSAVDSLVASMLEKPQSAIEIGKSMFYQQLEMPVAEAYDFAGNVMACNMMEADASEGIDAFIEKRRPTWFEEK